MNCTLQNISQKEPKLDNSLTDKFAPQLFLLGDNIGAGGLRTEGKYKQSLKGRPLVTVITVVFNGVTFLEETILSVLNQTYDNVEYIIIDGGSTDGTVGIVKSYEHAIDYWISQKDKGISDAFNKGIISSTGDFLLFINAGDTLQSDTSLAEMIPDLVSNIRTDLVYGKIILVDGDRDIKEYGMPINWELLRRHMNIPHQALFHNRSFFEKYGLYDCSYKLSMDYDLLLRAYRQATYHFVDIVISRMAAGGVSQSQIVQLYKEHCRSQIAHSVNSKYRALVYLYYNICSYYLKYIVKKGLRR